MKILSSYFSANGPGAALGIAVDGQEPRIECVGLADIGRGARIGPDTLFDLASGTKMFTATAVMLLVERGELDLTAPVADYLPLIERSGKHRPIVLGDLLSHTSGLPDYLQSGMYSSAEEVCPERINAQLPEWSRKARPGQHYSYCNTNYLVLANIIEAVSGSSYTEFIRANLIDPLGLRRSLLSTEIEQTADMARGYRVAGYGLPAIEAAEPFE
ncbi:MAG: serine hydrolase domain-containing protein, partial [Wenzhouxiangella sp.]|nr:serine hydrolase domain-containing protein [Wenzhouxiangella sp.]